MKMKRLINIARRMIEDGEVFYTTHTPRMTTQEYTDLSSLGFVIQSEHPHPPEIRMFYAMQRPQFEKKNRDLLAKLTTEMRAK